jgi:hypothetical protein
MRGRPLVLAVLATTLALPAAAHAAQTRFDEADGVRAVVVPGEKVVIRFTGRSAAALKRVRGRLVEAHCTDLPPRDGRIHGNLDRLLQAIDRQRVPRRGNRLVVREARRPDICFVESFARGHQLSVVAPVTDDGRALVDEAARIRVLFGTVALAVEMAARDGGAGWPSADRVASVAHGQVVALDAPDASPSLDKIGYWTDGARHMVVSTMTREGRRLFYEELDWETTRSNVVGSGSWLTFEP